jgi:hypothetical protein
MVEEEELVEVIQATMSKETHSECPFLCICIFIIKEKKGALTTEENKDTIISRCNEYSNSYEYY